MKTRHSLSPISFNDRLIGLAYQKQIESWPIEQQTVKTLQTLRAASPATRFKAAKSLKQYYEAQPAVMTVLVELCFGNHQKIALEALEELGQIDHPQAFWFLKDIVKLGVTKEIREKASSLLSLWQERIQEGRNLDEILLLPPAFQEILLLPPATSGGDAAAEGTSGREREWARGQVGKSPSGRGGDTFYAALSFPRPLRSRVSPSLPLSFLSQLSYVGRIYKIISNWSIQSLVLSMTTLAELLFLFANPISGLLLNIVTLLILLYKLLQAEEAQVSRLNTVLLLIPLMRILSLGLPLTALPQHYWLLVVAIPLFVAIFLVTQSSRQSWTRQELGLTLNSFPLQLLIGTVGLGLGWLQYQLLTPEPLATELTWQALWLPALILLISTSCLEELLFRGLLQSAAISVIGRSPAIIFVAALSTILHIGYASLPILAFIFAIGLAFGWFVARTNSIVGVILTHGLMNISLFLLWPLW